MVLYCYDSVNMKYILCAIVTAPEAAQCDMMYIIAYVAMPDIIIILHFSVCCLDTCLAMIYTPP